MKKLINKIKQWATKSDEPNMMHYVIASAVMIGFLMLAGCAKPGHQKGDTYKIMLGTKCAPSGTIQSPIWFHTTIGPKQVSEENCEKNK